jgi:hypothetical protein
MKRGLEEGKGAEELRSLSVLGPRPEGQRSGITMVSAKL